MNKSIEQLLTISKKKTRNIIGLMSGTSLDGLDIALCSISGNGLQTEINLKQFITIPYCDKFRNELELISSKKNIDLQQLCIINTHIGIHYANLINEALHSWGIKNSEIDIIASHGQSIYHAPKQFHQKSDFHNSTLQIGDADQIAVITGITTISDFRQKHIAAGGEGAPLAAYGDYILFTNQNTNRILLNIGGISNCTYIPKNASFNEVICTDIGPGNKLIDSWVKNNYENLHYDEDALIAKSGKVNYALLNSLLSHSFFSLPVPKTTGPELFNLDFVIAAIEASNTKHLSNEDIISTLTAMSAIAIINQLEILIKNNNSNEIIVSGGGIHNPLIMEYLQNNFEQASFKTTADVNINPDAKEAILFAILANEMIAGDESTFGSGSISMPNISMGTISFPI
jgi:anhydro-N-acetylmuramic acid kinase